MGRKYPKIHIKGVKTSKNHVKMVKIHHFSSFGVHIQEFAQTQLNFAPSHDGETVTWHDTQGVVNIVLKIQVPTSNCLGVKVIWWFGGKGWRSKLMN